MPKKIFLFVLAILLLMGTALKIVRADLDCNNVSSLQLGDIDVCKAQFGKTLDAISSANTHNAAELASLNAQITNLKNQIASLDGRLAKLTKDVSDRQVKVGVQDKLLSAKIRQDYIRKRDPVLLLMLFSSDSASDFFKDLSYRQKLADQDHQIIASISGEINSLNAQADNAKAQKTNLDALRLRIDQQATFLAGEVAKANAYVADLGGKISALTARQEAILAERTGNFFTTVGDVPLADDPNSRPDFNPGFSPAFAAFSFGAPHFKGLSQYGAYGRAKSGQSVDDILHAYYGGLEIKKDYSTGITINVQGYGAVDIETYTKRIYEMPESWGSSGGFEALKAQAVAARSYALAYTNNGSGSICATESCQVYKPSNKGGKWDEAVDATRGWVLMANGKPFSAWYASTSGGYQESYTANGYSTPAFWDTPSGRGGWTSQAYEKTGGSPWFYKGWYKTRSGDTCGVSHPWLTSEQMADIINAWTVLKNGSDDRVSPVSGCWGGNPYSISDLQSRGGYTSVSNVSVGYSDGGYTSSVHFDTNKGGVDISGADFKKAFNLRAPGRIALMSGLFNIEKK